MLKKSYLCDITSAVFADVRAQRDALLFLVFVIIRGIDHMAAGSHGQTQLLKIENVQCPAADNSIDQQ